MAVTALGMVREHQLWLPVDKLVVVQRINGFLTINLDNVVVTVIEVWQVRVPLDQALVMMVDGHGSSDKGEIFHILLFYFSYSTINFAISLNFTIFLLIIIIM